MQVTDLKLDLAAEVLTSFGAARLPVTGSSMFPCMRPGDVLEIARQNEAIRENDVVVFARHGRLVAHRVTDCTGAVIVTQGDRLRFPDQPVSRDAILGRVKSIHRAGRRIAPAPTLFTRAVSALLSLSDFATRASVFLASRVATYSARMLRP